MSQVLVVDDDRHIRDVVRFALEKAGFSVMEARDGAEALSLFDTQGVDLIVLDVVMPEFDGLEVCKRLRKTSDVPILFLSSCDDEIDRIVGLELGADDYITKPFSPRELVARVKAVLRRRPTATDESAPCPDEAKSFDSDVPPVAQRGRLVLDSSRHQCQWDGNEISLTATEFLLLRSLLGTDGRVYSRSELVDRAWGYGHHMTERTVDSHIRRIRSKLAELGADPIETVYGVGYRLNG